MVHLTNQIHIHLFHPNWFHAFIILAFCFTSFDDYDARALYNPSQENGFLHFSHEKDDSIMQRTCRTIQIDLSLEIPY